MTARASMRTPWVDGEPRGKSRAASALAPKVAERAWMEGRTTRRRRSWKSRMVQFSDAEAKVPAGSARAGTAGVVQLARPMRTLREGAMTERERSMTRVPSAESRSA